MRNKRYKRLQRKINHAIRNLNENIAADDLWKGRFVASQDAIHFATYEDKSGVCALVHITFTDLYTGAAAYDWFTNYDIIGCSFSYNKFNHGCGTILWEFMNEFVCNETRDLIFKEYKRYGLDYTKDKRWS